ncbi:LytR family transcriptional regulator [Ornithinibacillus sp. L9]|uniref:LytR family transcriptional regulator n=1 Tax=Ornithinibacillus caprae TaxID=2678566 RepID=A0A6N8FHY4_9BACI|nr:LCP family protein [Ornithinibacillus caprae]MUK87359.1 LytR family transcriptional regulator [Ornithinibacillus caprae]
MPKTKYKSKKRNWLLYSGLFILLLITVVIGYSIHLYQQTENMVNESHEQIDRKESKSELRSDHVDPVKDNVSVLFLGTDTSEHRQYGESSRTDAIILATFNKFERSIKLLSIPRDTYVFVPKVGNYTKINHAHFYGGPISTIETIEQFLDVPIDYYVRMNFDAFVEVVDALDGILFDVPYEIVESDSHDNKNTIHLTPGYQKLNGEQALALARTRKYDSDVDRGKRQQEIIKVIISKTTSISSVPKLSNVIEAIGDNLKTNLSFQEMKSFLSYGLDKDIEIETVNFEGKGSYMNGGWYYQIEEESKRRVQQELKNHLDIVITNNPSLYHIGISFSIK